MNIIILILFTCLAFGGFIPEIKKGEAKILFPCDILDSLPKESKGIEEVIFYDKKDLKFFAQGLIIRKRIKSNSSEMTVKFRSSKVFNLNQEIYDKLKSSPAGDFKCEADATYSFPSPAIEYSCSFTSLGHELTKEHREFIKMMGVRFETVEELKNLHSIKINASEWKYVKQGNSELKGALKKVMIEQWNFGTECLLEVSSKFDLVTEDEISVFAKKTMEKLINLIQASPSKVQGNKTGIVLRQSL